MKKALAALAVQDHDAGDELVRLAMEGLCT